jgi:PIN domain nuclease of toxin-antitoxin system
MKYLLDTHAWIWFNERPSELSRKVLKVLTAARDEDEFLLSVISVWEFCKLIQKRRIDTSKAPEAWIEAGLTMPRLSLAPLTARIALESTTLPAGLHNDPADQIIVATARIEKATIVTRDERMRAYPHVATVW